MKTSLLTLAAALSLLSTTATAQAVPNGNFETWVTRSGLEAPQNWTTVDEGIKTVPVFGGFYSAVTTTKDASSNTGALAAKMVTKTDAFISPLFGGPIPGGVILGSVNYEAVLALAEEQDIGAIGGLPFTTRAANMQFSYKLSGPNAAADSAYALVSLTRTTGGVVETIATGELRLLPAAAYTLGNIPLQYRSALAPDSIHVAFVSGLAGTITAGTTLFVDDVVMTGTVAAARNPVLEAALNVYPNPSTSGEFRLSSPSHPSVATAPYTITDATGHVVRTAAAAPASLANGRPLELHHLSAGLYLLRLHTPEGPVTRKLLIR